jgi:hypothetical protein
MDFDHEIWGSVSVSIENVCVAAILPTASGTFRWQYQSLWNILPASASGGQFLGQILLD